MAPDKSSRRTFLQGTASGLLGSVLSGSSRNAAAQAVVPPDLESVADLPRDVTRTWIGPEFWANRLQDWRLENGKIECLTGAAGDDVRTVALLTREIVAGAHSARISVSTGPAFDARASGFSGFLIGAGGGQLDYRAAALAQKASGEGGGILCVYEPSSKYGVQFREHSDEENPLAFAELNATHTGKKLPEGIKDLLLLLEISPRSAGFFDVRLTATSPLGEGFSPTAVLENIPEKSILGGIALVSSPGAGGGGRYWFQNVRAGGEKIARHPERMFGPILGALYSLSGKILKLSAQLAPIGDTEAQQVKFQHRAGGGAWRDGPVAQIQPGYTALFRIDDWDGSRDWEYRIVYPADSALHSYAGKISKDPRAKPSVSIGLFSCTLAVARSLEGGAPRPQMPQAEVLGRYTSGNIYFPHSELTRHSGYHQPDLLVFAGDQFYEGNPTRRDNSSAPTLDFLYKWYLWVWSFREMTRSTPAIVMVDDHDVYHGNLWGNGGRAAPQRDQNRGGYRCSGEFVNIVQRAQCGHNPDAYDPTPVDQGISVYYTNFSYDGIDFSVLEDRKCKTAPIQEENLDMHEAELLGERQEKFLAAWAKDRSAPKICLTQTLFACVQTSPAGRALLDFDSNGYPKPGRDRALQLLRDAGALVLAGDQHLATIVRHGIDGFTDGVLQFTGPAGGSSWQRWFEPAKPPANGSGQPGTGDFIDAFGNKLRVLAVANPKISFAEYRKYNKGRGQGLGDRRLKSEGYGIVRVNKKSREYIIECWPWNVDPGSAGSKQFPGWPYRLKFSETDGRKIGKK